MPVDARINTVQTEVTARDPDLLDARLVEQVVARVLAELERRQLEDDRRQADRRASRTSRGGGR